MRLLAPVLVSTSWTGGCCWARPPCWQEPSWCCASWDGRSAPPRSLPTTPHLPHNTTPHTKNTHTLNHIMPTYTRTALSSLPHSVSSSVHRTLGVLHGRMAVCRCLLAVPASQACLPAHAACHAFTWCLCFSVCRSRRPPVEPTATTPACTHPTPLAGQAHAHAHAPGQAAAVPDSADTPRPVGGQCHV